MEKKPVGYEETKDKALRLLTFRAHSEYELTGKLKHFGAREEDIEKTLDFCRRYNFVNDLQYAKSKAKDLQNLKKFGRRRIEAELSSKGISHELIEEAMSELDFDDNTELMRMVRKKLGGDFEKKSTDRCMRYFLYRGYGISEVKNCIDTIKNEEEYSDEL